MNISIKEILFLSGVFCLTIIAWHFLRNEKIYQEPEYKKSSIAYFPYERGKTYNDSVIFLYR